MYILLVIIMISAHITGPPEGERKDMKWKDMETLSLLAAGWELVLKDYI